MLCHPLDPSSEVSVGSALQSQERLDLGGGRVDPAAQQAVGCRLGGKGARACPIQSVLTAFGRGGEQRAALGG